MINDVIFVTANGSERDLFESDRDEANSCFRKLRDLLKQNSFNISVAKPSVFLPKCIEIHVDHHGSKILDNPDNPKILLLWESEYIKKKTLSG